VLFPLFSLRPNSFLTVCAEISSISHYLYLPSFFCLSPSSLSVSPSSSVWPKGQLVAGLFGNARGDRFPAAPLSICRIEAMRYQLSPRLNTRPLSHLALRQLCGCRAAGSGFNTNRTASHLAAIMISRLIQSENRNLLHAVQCFQLKIQQLPTVKCCLHKAWIMYNCMKNTFSSLYLHNLTFSEQ